MATALAVPVVVLAQTNTPDAAQSDETERDRSFIVGFLEDRLSGAGRDIRIEGFKGLLSSTATLDTLTIADDDGIWFTLSGAELDWSRRALLGGQLEINSISAQEITLERWPQAQPSPATPEATPFSLPELPVSIDIGAIAAERVSLGASVLGIGAPLDLTVTGEAHLKGGAGSVALDIARIDGPVGAFVLDAGYDNTTGVLDLDLSLTEGPGGIFATLTGLPGAPDLAFTAKGSGPLDDFAADIVLSTLGQPRLSGQVSLASLEPETPQAAPAEGAPNGQAERNPRRFAADLSGDVTPLFAEDYAKFFGPDTHLLAQGVSYPDGRMTLDSFDLATMALTLTGALAIDSDGLPASFEVTGGIMDREGAAVLLPIAGPKRFIDRAALSAKYDASAGEAWTATAQVNGYKNGTAALEAATLTATGTISRRDTEDVSKLLRAVKAQIDLVARGIELADPALQDAVGTDVTGRARIVWTDGAPIELSSLKISAQGTELEAQAVISDFDSGFAVDGQADLRAPDLSRFAGLIGAKTSGAARIQAKGQIIPLSGKFNADIVGTGDDLRIGIPQVDALIGGQSQFSILAARDESGLTLREADLSTQALSAQASGAVSTDAANLTVAARLDDVARLTTGLSGPLTMDGTVIRTGAQGRWITDTTFVGPGNATVQIVGAVAQSFDDANLRLVGAAPLGLANSFTTAALIQGTAAVDLKIVGPIALSSLKGTVTTGGGAHVVIPSANLDLAIERSAISIAGPLASLDAVISSNTGGTVTATGTLGLKGGLLSNLTATLNNLGIADPDLFSTTVSGQVGLMGPLLGTPLITGQVTLGQTDVLISPAAFGAGGDIPEIKHIAEPAAVLATRARAGVLGKDSGAARDVGLDITVDAPNQIFIRGRGLDAELGGRLRLTGSTQNIIPVGQFNLVRGRLNILGKRLDMQQGQLVMQGDFDPTFNLVAETRTEDLTVQVITSGRVTAPVLTLTSLPELPEEEILAQLLFGRALTEISILQAAQMAAAVSTLTGGGGGLVGSIRENFGLDDLDVTTSEEGATEVRIGKYLSDRLYTDVTIDSEGKSVINLNLDATDDITVKGSATSDGDTGIGVFFEKDY